MKNKIISLLLVVLLLILTVATPLSAKFGTPNLVATQPLDDRLRTVMSFTVSDFQPAIDRTGPMNWIARNPRNLGEVFASSVSGGLWRSTDAGNNWQPIRSLKPWSVSAVAFLFDGTAEGAVLVTTREDLRLNSGAGVWRSDDHGLSWTQVAHVSAECGDKPRAHGIAVRGTKVLVATSCGVLRSSDGLSFTKVPVSDFTPSGVLSSSEHFYSVEFSPSGAVLLGGEAGFFRQFHAASGPPGDVLRMTGDNGEMRRAFGVPGSTRFPVVLGLAGGQGIHRMMISLDDGASWRRVASGSSGPGGGAGGSPFVRIIPTRAGANEVFVYYGDSLGWYRAGPFPNGDLSSLARDAGIRWEGLTIGHPDPHDVDFVNLPGDPLDRRAMLLATDGGLEICNFGRELRGAPICSESRVLGTDRGLSPIQVMNLKGQIIGSGESALRRLYMNTWHTDAWAYDGRTWIRRGGETAWLQMERNIASTRDAQIVYNNNALPNMLGRDLRADPIEFIDAPNVSSPPVLVEPTVFSETGTTADQTRLYIAEGVTHETMPRIRWVPWLNYQTCDASGACVPLSISAASVLAGYLDPAHLHAVLYQPYWDRLARVNLNFIRARGRFALRAADIIYPRMNWAGHEVKLGLAYTPFTGFNTYSVLGADPFSPQHVVIPDTNNEKVMRSIDGGETWTPITGLAEAVTRDNRDPRSPRIFQFRRWVDYGFQSMVSSISFFPEDSNLVMLGTVENGLFISQDRGLTWQHIPNTEHIKNVLSLYWRSANSVIVGSWGRGLFEITIRYLLPRHIIDSICGGCAVRPISRSAFSHAVASGDFSQPSAFDSASLILNGRISGVEIKQGQIQKVWTTVGSSEYRFGGPNANFGFSTEEHTGFMGFKDLPEAEQLRKEGKVVKGLGFTNRRVTHVIYGSEETLIRAPSPLQSISLPGAKDPQLKDPYLRIFGPGMIVGTIKGGQTFDLQGFLFQRNGAVEVEVDGRVTAQLRTDATGKFATRLTAPSSIGPHIIVARQSVGNQIVRAVIGFSVNNSDTK
jgi:hypothetical protein